MKAVLGAVALLLVIGAIARVFVYSGWFNVAASEPHSALVSKLLRMIMKNSVEARAKSIAVPHFNADMVARGASHYKENCAGCHGAPGEERGEIGKGLTPPSPDLAETAEQWTAAELYWIVKHGIRMTGMPAWAETHSDRDLWAVVAFVTRMPQLDAKQYEGLAHSGEAQAADHH